jgi:hypothetical protein
MANMASNHTSKQTQAGSANTSMASRASRHEHGKQTQAWQDNIHIESRHKQGKQANTSMTSRNKHRKQTQEWQANIHIESRHKQGEQTQA